MKKKYGFTLIELLAVISILGVLLLVAVPAFTKYVLKGENLYYRNLESSVKNAGKEYINDNPNFLPKDPGVYIVIKKANLIDSGIMENIYDKNEKECEEANVYIGKTRNGKYSYDACLKCGTYKTNKSICNGGVPTDNLDWNNPKEYAITYNLNGGTINNPPTTYSNKSNNISIPNPTKTGYTFSGWTGSGSGINLVIPAGSAGNKKYTATWTPIKYKITYNLSGGTINETTSYTIESKTITLPAPTRVGYTFTGWSGDGTGMSVSIPSGSMGNKTYTANWTPSTYTITYILNGGSISNQPKSYTIESSNLSIPNPTKEDYNFAGWTGSGTGTNLTLPTGSTENKTYTATWTPKTCIDDIKYCKWVTPTLISASYHYWYDSNGVGKTVATSERSTTYPISNMFDGNEYTVWSSRNVYKSNYFEDLRLYIAESNSYIRAIAIKMGTSKSAGRALVYLGINNGASSLMDSYDKLEDAFKTNASTRLSCNDNTLCYYPYLTGTGEGGKWYIIPVSSRQLEHILIKVDRSGGTSESAKYVNIAEVKILK